MTRIPRQLYRDPDSVISNYTGPQGEPALNTTTGRLHVQDGVTKGGVPHALMTDLVGSVITFKPPSLIARSLQSALNEQLRLSDFGPIGTADDTGTWTAAINYINGTSGYLTLCVPAVVTTFGNLPAITVPHIYVRGVDLGCTTLRGTQPNGLQWSTNGIAVQGGGASHFTADTTSTNTVGAFLNLPHAYYMSFHDIYVSGNIGRLASCGSTASGVGANNIEFDNIWGQFANVGVPLFDLVGGGGFMLSRLYGQVAANAGSCAAGRHLVSITNASWDTVQVHDCQTIIFDSILNINATGNTVIQNIFLNDNIFDNPNQGVTVNINSGSTVASLEVKDNWITPINGPQVSIQGAGTCFGSSIDSNKLTQSGTHGIVIGVANCKLLSICHNKMYGLNAQNAASTCSILLQGSPSSSNITYQGIRVESNSVNANAAQLGPTLKYQCAYGISVNGIIDRFYCKLNDFFGTTANTSGLTTFAHTNSIIGDNIGQTTNG